VQTMALAMVLGRLGKSQGTTHRDGPASKRREGGKLGALIALTTVLSHDQ
jgi:hypothetical protein